MNRTPNRTPVTAAEDYQRRRELIDTLLAELSGKLENHAQRAAADPKNWGYPGDLGHIMGKLGEISDFLH